MKFDLYDFDDTIYHGNSPLHFFKFCRKRKLIKLSHFIKIPFKYLQYKTKIITYTQMSEFIFSCVKDIPNLDKVIHEFWLEHGKNVKPFYANKKDKSKDIIISASPEFLLKPFIDELGIYQFIGSDLDPKSGKASRPMCRGEEKVVQFKKHHPSGKVRNAYGNSSHDIPYMLLAENAFMLKGYKMLPFEEYKPGFIRRFIRWLDRVYNKHTEVINYIIAGGFTTVVSISSFILFSRALGMFYIYANILSWVVAVLFAYFAYRWFVFKSKDQKKFKQFIRFVEARIFSLIVDTALMFALVDFLDLDDVLSKIIVQFIVMTINYLISKFFVFKKS